MKSVIKNMIKYAILAVCGVILFIALHQAANAERPAAGVGGEALFLACPLLWWVAEKTAKDALKECKRIWLEIKSERAERERKGDVPP